MSQEEFALRTGLGRGELSILAKADAFHSLETTRRVSVWDALPTRESSLLYDAVIDPPQAVGLPPMTLSEEVEADYRTIGLSLRAHPVSFLRHELDARQVVRASDLSILEADRRYRVAGLVLLRQRPSTAKGITFMTIEDETGTTNLVVHVNVWERFRRVARSAGALIVRGLLQRQHGIIHLVVDKMDDLTELIGDIPDRSRNFR
jgi:error-prone DNA polymerase